MDSRDRRSYAIIFHARTANQPEGVITQPTTAMASMQNASLFVHLLPALIPPGSLRGGIAVVVDVLRASTVIVYALAAGCEAVVPCGEIDEARRVALSLPHGTALLAGERDGLPIPGFDLGNSPAEFTQDRCRGKTVVMTTTNGTRAILASVEADRVYITSFSNLAATARELSIPLLKRHANRPIHVICSGTGGAISLEDSLLAGALTAQLVECNVDKREYTDPGLGNDEAVGVLAQWSATETYLRSRPLWKLLGIGRGGQHLRRIGRDDDIQDAAVIDRFDIVAELHRVPPPLRIEAVS
jgi:2-phosphosulfolactate phosphatase